MSYYVDNVRRGCVDLFDATIHCNVGKCTGDCRRYLFVVLTIVSLGCLIAFILGMSGAIAMSKTGLGFTGVIGGLAGGMLMLDCLRCIGCR